MKSGRIRFFFAILLLLGCASFANADYGGKEGYAGSDSCRECHPEDYAQWVLTPHSRMLVDAERDPFSILADDFTSIPFTPDDILFSVGSHWVQKYLTKIDGALYVLPKYWNVPERKWEPYSIWNWREQPYNIHCDGCHTVGFDPETETFFEPGIGCEACHGPGKEHVDTGGRQSAIVNPAKLDPDRAMMICMSCHTDGMDTITGKYPFPVGYIPGDDLTQYFSDFFMPKPKSRAWYWGSMDFLERKRMYYFFQSKFYSTSRACEVCGFDRGTTKKKERYMSRSEYCGTCHKHRYENFLEHSGHRPENTLCTDCHVPSQAVAGQSYSIHDHKFDFSQPEPACTECHPVEEIEGKERPEDHDFHLARVKYPRELTIEEACILCHKEEDVSWARKLIPELVDRFIVE